MDRIKPILDQISVQRDVRQMAAHNQEVIAIDNLFTLNRSKSKNEKNEREDNPQYITSFNNRRNPDLLIPGGALKGNMYFKVTNE